MKKYFRNGNHITLVNRNYDDKKRVRFEELKQINQDKKLRIDNTGLSNKK